MFTAIKKKIDEIYAGMEKPEITIKVHLPLK